MRRLRLLYPRRPRLRPENQQSSLLRRQLQHLLAPFAVGATRHLRSTVETVTDLKLFSVEDDFRPGRRPDIIETSSRLQQLPLESRCFVLIALTLLMTATVTVVVTTAITPLRNDQAVTKDSRTSVIKQFCNLSASTMNSLITCFVY